MSIFRNNNVGNWTRGGQAIVHNVRMSTQVFFQTLAAALVIWVMGSLWYLLEVTPRYEQYTLGKWAVASIKTNATQGANDPIKFKTRDGREYWTTDKALIDAPAVRRSVRAAEHDLINGTLISGAFALAMFVYACWYFASTGKGLGSNQFLRGASFGTPRQLRWLFRRGLLAKGCLAVAGVRVPRDYETQHVLLLGAPGTGKTNMMGQMLAGVRGEAQLRRTPAGRGIGRARHQLAELLALRFWRDTAASAGRQAAEIAGLRAPPADGEGHTPGPRSRHRRAIVFDISGAYVERFYRHGIDQIFNPLDTRGAKWKPWIDAKVDYHYDQIAESVVPDKAGDPFWAKSARGVLVALMRKLAAQQQTLTSVLLDILTRAPIGDLTAFAQGTDAAAYISPEGEKTSAGVRAEAASVMKSFAYLDDTEEGISIREWVANERDDSWLFITCKADQLPALRPLITTWLDIAISAIMSLTPDQHRRIFVAIDELAALQKLPSLPPLLAMGRKYGGCAILGIQSYPQLEDLYGIAGAASLTGYCSTWVSLRANDNPTAELVSKKLGKVEQVEANEGMSYGVNDMRDGVNLSRMQVTRPLVMDTEIGQLADLEGYLYFGRNLPVVHFTDVYVAGDRRAPAFKDRSDPPVRLPAGQAIIAEHEAEAARQAERKQRREQAALPKARKPAGALPLFEHGGGAGELESDTGAEGDEIVSEDTVPADDANDDADVDVDVAAVEAGPQPVATRVPAFAMAHSSFASSRVTVAARSRSRPGEHAHDAETASGPTGKQAAIDAGYPGAAR